MRIALFIPCYIDALFPELGIATLELLERFGMSFIRAIRAGIARCRTRPNKPSTIGTKRLEETNHE